MQRQHLHLQQDNGVSAVNSSSTTAAAAATLSSLTANAHLDGMHDPFIEYVTPYLTNQGDDTKSIRDLSSAARSCRYFYTLFQPKLNDLKLLKLNILLQAVIDDKVDVVKKLLDKNPTLIFVVTDKDLVIESSYTWQRFNVKNTNALKIAAKRKQLGMIELLLSYCNKLPQTDAIQAEKASALSAWTPYQMETNAEGKKEIVIPSVYKNYMQSLMNAFIIEPFPNGTGTRDDPIYTHLSNETEANLYYLFNLLLPKNVVLLDDEYVDVELLLLAAYKAYRDPDNFFVFQNWEQREAFCFRVIGLIMTALPPEMGKIFCEGLLYMQKRKKISERAQSLMLEDSCCFYRSSRDSRSGAGFDYFCGGIGFTSLPSHDTLSPDFVGGEFQTICRQRQEVFESYTASTASARPAHRAV